MMSLHNYINSDPKKVCRSLFSRSVSLTADIGCKRNHEEEDNIITAKKNKGTLTVCDKSYVQFAKLQLTSLARFPCSLCLLGQLCYIRPTVFNFGQVWLLISNLQIYCSVHQLIAHCLY